MPLIEKIERRLDGWNGKLLSRVGRLLLANSFLASIPIYFMGCFMLPYWAILRIDKIRRQFLWGTRRESHSLTGMWCVCQKNGVGLGCRIRNCETSPCYSVGGGDYIPIQRPFGHRLGVPDSQLKAKSLIHNGPRLFIKGGSFFWRQLAKIKNLFHWCCTWKIRDGRSISFWFDGWNGMPIFQADEGMIGIPRPTISFREASPVILDMIPLIQFTDEEDQLCWRWSSSESYSANSVYKAMISAGKTRWRYQLIWKCAAPPNAKLFAFLMLREKLLTHELMSRRDFNCDINCQTCTAGRPETLVHLLFTCAHAKAVWRLLTDDWGYGFLSTEGASLADEWEISLSRARATVRFKMKQWLTRIICACWHIWKHRNGTIFRGQRVPPFILANRIIGESLIWERY